jgi:hypothetical protein
MNKREEIIRIMSKLFDTVDEHEYSLTVDERKLLHDHLRMEYPKDLQEKVESDKRFGDLEI